MFCSRKKIKLLWNLLKHIRIENNDKTWNTIVVCQRIALAGTDNAKSRHFDINCFLYAWHFWCYQELCFMIQGW